MLASNSFKYVIKLHKTSHIWVDCRNTIAYYLRCKNKSFIEINHLILILFAKNFHIEPFYSVSSVSVYTQLYKILFILYEILILTKPYRVWVK